jgi:hypothetical protein
MNHELERIWKKVVVAYSSYYTGICLEELRKTMKKHGQDSRCPGRDSNQASPKYESRALRLSHPASPTV